MDGSEIVTTLVAEDELSEALEAAAEAGEELAVELDPLAEFLREMKEGMDDAANAIDAMEESLEEQKDALDEELDAAEAAAAGTDELAEAFQGVQEYAKEMEDKVRELTAAETENTEATSSWLEQLGAVGAIVTGVKSAWDMFSDAIESTTGVVKGWVMAAAESEVAGTKLGAILDATGNAAGYTKDQLIELSNQMEKTTRFEAETTQGAMSMLAVFKNVRGDIFKGAIESAANLAEVMGGDITSAARQLGMALEQPGRGLERLKRAGVTFTEQEKEKIKVLAESGKVLEAQQMILDKVKAATDGVAEKMGGTLSGQLAIAQHRLGNLSEDMGAMFIPVVKELIPLIDVLINTFEMWKPTIEAIIKSTIDWSKAFAEDLKPWFDWFVEAMIGAGTVIELLIDRWDDAFKLIGNTVAYQFAKMYNVISYYLTEVIPEVFKWFTENAGTIILDFANMYATVFKNMGKNVVDFFTFLKGWLSGEGGTFEFTALTDGFETSLKKLPEIAARMEGPMEAALREEMERLAESMGVDFNERLKKNLTKAKEVAKKKEDEDIGDAAATDPIDLGRKEKKAKEDKAKAAGAGAGQMGGFEDLTALYQRISAAAAKSPEVAVAEKQLDFAKLKAQWDKDAAAENNKRLDEINANLKKERERRGLK